MQQYSENLYADYIESCMKSMPVSFLDVSELKYLDYLTEKVLINYTRKMPGTNYDVSFIVSSYVEYFLEKKVLTIGMIKRFCIWLAIFELDASFSEKERMNIHAFFLQIMLYVKQTNECLPDEQENASDDFFDEQLEQLSTFKKLIESKNPKIKSALEKECGKSTGKLYEAMQSAHDEGMKLLTIPENLDALNSLMTATKVDENHEEFVITGEHRGNTHINSSMQRGFTKLNGLKSSAPIFSVGENVLFQSHPSRSPLSMNEKRNFYNPKEVRKGGDLGFVCKSNKKMFAINTEGDIFYSNPNLAGVCLNEVNGCTYLGQVYLGNIRDMKK